MSLLHPKYRPDIDGLRAIAVLSVIAFHAFPNLVGGGFVGVDIFFVISGYLITTILLENLDSNSFTFIEFYSRRIRRIFPALFLILFGCYAFGWFALYASEYEQLGKHIVAGASFVQNFVLWNESGYFDNSSDTKPLIHLWSLAIEEQFYIFWPLILWGAYRIKTNILKLTLVILILSFLVNILTIGTNPIASFYSPLSRFWELLLGAVWANIILSKRDITNQFILKFSNQLSGIGLLLIVLCVLLLNKKSNFPGWLALLPTIGALMLITADTNTWINRNILSSKLMVWIGLISYPLYLWHWPLLSFSEIITAGALTAFYKVVLIFVSIILAYLTYRYWEKFLRHKGNKIALILLILVGLIGSQGWSAYVRNGLDFRQKNILDLHGGRPAERDDGCLKKYAQYGAIFCRLSNETQSVETILIGDSFAHNDYSGLATRYSKDGKNFSMLGWPGHQPLLKEPFEKNFNQIESERMNRLINGLGDDKEVKTIVLSMRQPIIDTLITNQIQRTVKYLEGKGKNVIFIYPPPVLKFDPIECVGMPPFRPILNESCVQVVKDIDPNYSEGRVKLRKLINEIKIKSYDTYPQICNENVCQIRIADGLLYRNTGYFTTLGSEKVFQNFKE